jgi:hypothetical protein
MLFEKQFKKRIPGHDRALGSIGKDFSAPCLMR